MERLFSEVKLVNNVTAPCAYQYNPLKCYTRSSSIRATLLGYLAWVLRACSAHSAGVKDWPMAPQQGPEH